MPASRNTYQRICYLRLYVRCKIYEAGILALTNSGVVAVDKHMALACMPGKCLYPAQANPVHRLALSLLCAHMLVTSTYLSGGGGHSRPRLSPALAN